MYFILYLYPHHEGENKVQYNKFKSCQVINKKIYIYIMEYMKIRTVYVDMDGVLANFAGYYHQLFKKNVDIVNADGPENNLERGVSDQEMWRDIDTYGKSKFFEDLPWLPRSKEMWNFITENFMRVKILSALGKTDKIDKETTRGKMAWLSHHLPNLREHDIILVENKHRKRHYSKPGEIIVDDTPIVIQEWRNKGGTGILFKSAENTIEELKKYIYEEV